MTPYRFLTPADEEMSEAAVFYETKSSGLGTDYLNEVQHVIDLIRVYPKLGKAVDQGA